jgi:hypothetical protein
MQMIFQFKQKNMFPKYQEKIQEKIQVKSQEKLQEVIVNIPISSRKYDMFLKASYSKKCPGCGY